MPTETKRTSLSNLPAAPVTSCPQTLSGAQGLLAPVVTDLIGRVTRKRPGQPTIRSQEMVSEVLERIACGETLVRVCSDAHMPGYSTFRRWCDEDPSLLENVDRAYEWHARVLDDIADDMLAGGPTSTGDFRRDEARANHMRWRLGKLNRRRFGDKVQVDLTETHQVFVMPTDIIDGEGF